VKGLACKVGLALLVTLCIVTVAIGQQGCFTIVVGSEASADGSVIMAHNEDDSPPQVVNHYKVPRKHYEAGELIHLMDGGTLPQTPMTLSYIWAEMPGMRFSDSFLNEKGVCITSDNCPSREDQPELIEGGITKMLRQIVAQRATTALEGVKLAGTLVDKFGYGAPGRTYIISDPAEGWLFAVAKGRHWLAARVPDDEVAMIANTYSIHNVDLSDTVNFRASADIVTYAEKRGWYDPEDGDFDFAASYANPNVASSGNNFYRQWAALNHLSIKPIEASPHLPFSIKPRRKVEVDDIMAILRDHYRGSDLEVDCNPHDNPVSTICGRSTQTSFVAKLRNDLPAEIGLCYWATVGPPCGSLYLPFYFGIAEFPEGYVSVDEQPDKSLFWDKVNAPFKTDNSQAFWIFSNFFYKMDADYLKKMNAAQNAFRRIEARNIAMQDSIETKAMELYSHDKVGMDKRLTDYSSDLYLEALEVMEDIIQQNSNH